MPSVFALRQRSREKCREESGRAEKLGRTVIVRLFLFCVGGNLGAHALVRLAQLGG